MKALLLPAVLLFLLSCGSAPEADPEGIEQITERYLEASGGRRAIEALEVIHTVDSITIAGLSGLAEAWWVKEPFSGRTSVDLGVVRQEVLMIGDSVWSVDRNGHLSTGSVEALQEAELARKTVFYDVFLNPSDLETGPDTLIDGITAWRMIIPGDTPITLFISSRTGLPVLARISVMGLHILQYPSDYQELDGVLTARRTRDLIPAFGQESVTRNLVTEYNVPVPDSVFSIRETGVDWELTGAGQPVPFEFSGGHIYLEGAVSGKPVTVLLDSGAGATVVDSVLAAELELIGAGEFVAQGIGGAQSVSFVEVPVYSVAGASVTGQNLAVMSLDIPFYPATGKHIGLVLGYDFLSRFVTGLDFGTGEITLWDPDSFEYTGDGEIIPVTQTMSLLSVEAVLEDSVPVTLLLDTGAGGNLHLTPTFFRDYPDFLGERSTFETVAQGVGGEEVISAFRISSVTLGDLRIPCGISSSFAGAPILSQYHGILGTGILSRFRLWLDYGEGTIILEPSSLFYSGLPEDMTGIGLETDGKMIVVRHVVEGSPGDLAGLLRGDVILSVEGVELRAEDMVLLDQIFPSTEGMTLVLKVLRDDAELEIEITTARLLPEDQLSPRSPAP
jgi:hypothetical protein